MLSAYEEKRQLALSAPKLTPSRLHSLQTGAGGEAHPADPCRAMLSYKSHAPDRRSPHKEALTLFWNANTPNWLLAARRAFGLGESLVRVGLSTFNSLASQFNNLWIYETVIDDSGQAEMKPLLLSWWDCDDETCVGNSVSTKWVGGIMSETYGCTHIISALKGIKTSHSLCMTAVLGERSTASH